MGPRSSPEPGVVRTMSVKPWSPFGSVTPTLVIAVGAAAIVGGTWGLIKPWGSDNSRSGFAFLLIWGFFAATMGLMQFVVIARHVDQLVDGHLRFRSRLKSLTVRPDEIISMIGWSRMFDLYGSYPFKVKTARGSIRVDRHMSGGVKLEAALREANPHLTISRAWEITQSGITFFRPEARMSDDEVSNTGPR